MVPLEVLGVPLNRLQASAMMRAQQAQMQAANQMGQANMVPQQQSAPGAVGAPSPVPVGSEATPMGMSDQAQPLGTVGSVEQAAGPDMTQR
jgi:hypothetical protein